MEQPLRPKVRRRVLALLALALVSNGPSLLAATITVDGSCSLVEAIQSANADQAVGGCSAGEPGEDTLVLTVDVTLTESHNFKEGENGLPRIVSEITIEGGGRTLARAEGPIAFRFFYVEEGAVLILNDLTATNAELLNSDGVGILNRGTFVMQRSALTEGDGPCCGHNGVGGLLNRGKAILIDSVVSDNFTHEFTGGISNVDGAELTLVRSVVADNTGKYAYGGLWNGTGATMTLIDSEVTGNDCFGDLGVGPGAMGNATGATATLIHTTVSDNTADYIGGIQNSGTMSLIGSTVSDNSEAFGSNGAGGISNFGVLRIENSTLSGNVAGRTGAGLHNFGEATLVHSTLAGNRAGMFYGGEGEQVYSTGTLRVRNSILAHTEPGGFSNCAGNGTWTDLGGNFADDGSCGAAEPIQAGFDFDPLLADNGGVTLTHALLPGSVAVDAGVDCGLILDQRGYLRDGACDSGSFELGGVEPTPPSLALSGSCPGELTATVSGATPNGSVILAGAAADGVFAVDMGLCSGTVLDLTDPRFLSLVAIDGAGNGSLTQTLSASACGLLLQAVDAVTCAASSVLGIPDESDR